MSFVSTQPEALTAAAGIFLQGIGSAMSAQNAAAAAPTGTSAGSYAVTRSPTQSRPADFGLNF